MTGSAPPVTEEFWNFSLALYARPGVAEYCLRLQDEIGANVNLLLLCCWAGRYGMALNADTLAAAIAAIENCEAQVLRPLRARRRTPGLAPDARQHLLAEEIAAERHEQMLLVQCLENLGLPYRDPCDSDGGTALAGANLIAYCSILNTDPDDHCPLLSQTAPIQL